MKRCRVGFCGPLLVMLASILIGIGVCHSLKPLPEGLSEVGGERHASSVRFLRDLTFHNEASGRVTEHEIFDSVFSMIDRAESFVLVDMFLFNPFLGAAQSAERALSQELTDRILRKREQAPHVEIVVITDPINELYGGCRADHLEQLRGAGIRVVVSRLSGLRDSNPSYSSLWRLGLQWWGNRPGILAPNPLGSGRVSARSYLHLLNFKANHRKVILADDTEGLIGLVASANPHDGSAAHENVALQFRGTAVLDLLRAENAVLKLSHAKPLEVQVDAVAQPLFLGGDELTLQVATEGKIKEKILQTLATVGADDRVDLVMFYLSHRDILRALRGALARGAELRVVLDPNRDAFGWKKSGMPNRLSARELIPEGAEVRWRETRGEQCHSKLLYVEYADGGALLALGSANYTRRNLDDLNLELNVFLKGLASDPVFGSVRDYFNLLWSDGDGDPMTVPYERYRDESLIRRQLCRLMEWSGVCTW